MSFAEIGAFGEVHFLCVGTPEGESGRADLGSVYAAAEALAPHLTSPCLVVGKSTVPVGTARQVMTRMRAIAPAGERGRPGLEPGVPAGGVRGAGQPGPRPHRARRDLRAGRGAAAPGLPRAARGGQPAAGDGPGDGRTGQGGRERVPRDQDLLHQRHGRGLRAGGRRRDPAGRGARLRRADRAAVPVARARLRRRLPAQGHPRVPRHRRGPGRELAGEPAGHGGRDQPRPPGAGGRAGPPGRRGLAGRLPGGRARRRVQAGQRRRAGLPQPGRLRPPGRPRGRSCRCTTRWPCPARPGNGRGCATRRRSSRRPRAPTWSCT